VNWLLPILRHRITWGAGIALGVLIACAWHGHNKYAEGHRDATADAERDAIAARAVSDSVTQAQRVAIDSATAKAQRAEVAAARATARAHVAQHRVRGALASVVVDSTTPDPVRALVTETSAALDLWDAERAGFEAQLAAKDAIIATQQQHMAGEPQRMTDAIRVALAEQRRTFRGPSRVRWLITGVVLGVAAGALAP
jgi:hypothetical protein